MSKHEFNKAVEYKGYAFNINVKLNCPDMHDPDKAVRHLVKINDLGPTNYYQTYVCDSDHLEKMINTAYSNACAWVDELEHREKSVEQIVLEKIGFEKMEDNTFENIKFPFVKNVSAKGIGADLFPYSPGDPNNMRKWDKMLKGMAEKIKSKFDKKGIPMPTIVIDSDPDPITYAIKTTDENGNVIHSQP